MERQRERESVKQGQGILPTAFSLCINLSNIQVAFALYGYFVTSSEQGDPIRNWAWGPSMDTAITAVGCLGRSNNCLHRLPEGWWTHHAMLKTPKNFIQTNSLVESLGLQGIKKYI